MLGFRLTAMLLVVVAIMLVGCGSDPAAGAPPAAPPPPPPPAPRFFFKQHPAYAIGTGVWRAVGGCSDLGECAMECATPQGVYWIHAFSYGFP